MVVIAVGSELGDRQLNNRSAASFAGAVDHTAPHPAFERSATGPLAGATECVGEPLLDSLERRVAVARDRPRDPLEPAEVRPVERFDLWPEARLVHLEK